LEGGRVVAWGVVREGRAGATVFIAEASSAADGRAVTTANGVAR
jgi:hypothetical protein